MSEYNKPAHERDLYRLSMEDAAIADAERAVIEAAEALAAALTQDAGYGFCLQEIDDVCNAVEALQKARQG